MKRFAFFGLFAAGVIAAYLMQKRGEGIFKILKTTISNPVGALADEVKLLMPGSFGDFAGTLIGGTNKALPARA